MADDTRLADASLLLNYSHQSYKEQQLQQQSKGLLATSATQSKPDASPDSRPATPRRSSWDSNAHRPSILSTTNNQRGTSPQVDQYITLSTNGHILPTSPDFLCPCPLQPPASPHPVQQTAISVDQMAASYVPPDDITPMDNLFAAINCALPPAQMQNKPVIVDKVPSNGGHLGDVDVATKRVWANPIDHDYCVKSPKQTLKLVAVHLGAGTSAHNEVESLRIARSICEEVMLASQSASSMQNSSSRPTKDERPGKKKRRGLEPIQYDAESAVVQLVKRMEDHQALNCGYGSNLNMNGQVECDASMMSDKTQMWAGVGALAGCKNPIVLAKSLYDHRRQPRPLGLIQPNLLVGSGARQWMRDNCPSLAVAESKMISPGAFATYQKLKSRFDQEKKSFDNNQPEELMSKQQQQQQQQPLEKNGSQYLVNDNELASQHLDTVGAVCVDCDNNFASAISSGGLLLKYKGRVGQAAVPGAGCWSESSIAITTTGVGEYLTLSLFAKKVFEKMQTLRLLYDLGHVERNSNQSNVISAAVEECFEELVRSPALAHVRPNERRAGLLSVETFNRCGGSGGNGNGKTNGVGSPLEVSAAESGEKSDLYLTFAHNTPTMCVGYMTCDDIVGHSIMSRQLNMDSGGAGCGSSANVSASSDLTTISCATNANIGSTNGESKVAINGDSHNKGGPPTIVRTTKFSLDSETNYSN